MTYTKVITGRDNYILGYDFIDKSRKYSYNHEMATRMLSDILKNECNITYNEAKVIKNEHGKPRLSDSDMEYNLSHTNGMVLCGISKDGSIGVDVEPVKDTVDMIIPKFMTDREAGVYGTLNTAEKKEYFYRIWTLKEALAKAKGTGIDDEFKDTEFYLDLDTKYECGRLYSVASDNSDYDIYTGVIERGEEKYVMSVAVHISNI